MARATGYAPSTIHRMWQALIPAAPPQRDLQALVLRGQGARHRRAVHGLAAACPGSRRVHEKSQVQALDRTQPLLPLRPGQIERRTHDYKPNGRLRCSPPSTSPPWTVIGQCHRRHRSAEFRKFLARGQRSADLDIHIAWTTIRRHKTKAVRDWFAGVRAGMSISRRPLPHGSTRSSASSPICGQSQIRRGVIERRWSRAITDGETRQRGPQAVPNGTRRPTTSWHPSSASAARTLEMPQRSRIIRVRT